MPNLVSNGDFDASPGWDSGGWTIADDSAYISSGQVGTLSQDCLGSGQRVEVRVKVATLVGDPLIVWLGQNKIAEITKPGNYFLYGESSTISSANNPLKFQSTTNNETRLESVAVYPLEVTFALIIMDVENVIVDARTLADDIADANYTFFRVWEDVVTVSFDWDYITDAVNGLGLSYGCYKLGLATMCENTNAQLGVLDPDFNIILGNPTADSYPWFLQAGSNEWITINNGLLTFSGDVGTVASSTIEDGYATPSIGDTYDVTLVIDSISDAEVVVQLGGDISATYTTSGTKTFQLTAVNTNGIRLITRDDSGANAGAIVISSINFEQATTTDWVADYTSNAFRFESSHPCTKLLTGANDVDAFQLKFGGALYNPQVRLKGTLRASSFDDEIEGVINANYQREILYFSQRKIKELRLSNVPEYLSDFLSIWRGFSVIFVDGEELIGNERGFEVNYNRFCDSSSVVVMLEEKRQVLESEKTSGQLAFTNINNYLVLMENIEEKLVFLDNDEIQING